ncbi:MAG: cytochrome C oxidase subunit IV family protein [Candidatus Marinimicrobia bacterium]|jgi:caa(3)-type oxidase subunit IV|nr:cytochrome C oxidase subunit IV family protein [Candidatus Neomarinimicrobiota bacterium]MDP6593602.1 cytochrome C oxidase subunit IV family protein [Candidatus Neomarinimicrobiota bacterium]MDP6836247.1 cytochrome C oxidase subunit IV family protein [Candidatus Neomarinimicrobiota bacterium]MDP6966166.1 cytochrome C oxidase subunit IV family protein [Candidatus Neomarinimicrobiota bacterium]|tara:strand:+ start:399 stop:680 length:282 start_codon:yes stop_codon:yes gene_type:complete
MSDAHKKTYLQNAIWLAVLTVLELGVINLSIPRMGQIVLLFAFAATKMMLVAMVYMHLRYETKVLRRILFIPIPAGIIFAWALMYDLPFRWVM